MTQTTQRSTPTAPLAKLQGTMGNQAMRRLLARDRAATQTEDSSEDAVERLEEPAKKLAPSRP